jgi:hypothetical protein
MSTKKEQLLQQFMERVRLVTALQGAGRGVRGE